MKKLAVIAAAALMVAGCGAEAERIDSSSVVAEVLETARATTSPSAGPTTTTTPSISIPPGCRLVTERDPYGFEVEVLDCGDPPDVGPGDEDWLGSDGAKAAATLLRTALLDQAECGRYAAYLELKELVSEAKRKYREPLLEAIASLEAGVPHCGANRRAWVTAMRTAVAHLEQFMAAVEEDFPGTLTGSLR